MIFLISREAVFELANKINNTDIMYGKREYSITGLIDVLADFRTQYKEGKFNSTISQSALLKLAELEEI